MWMLKIRLASSSNYVQKTFWLSFVVFGDVGFVNKLMLLVQFLFVYLYCRRVFYFGPHNILWLYEVGLHIYHCRMEVVLAALVISFCSIRLSLSGYGALHCL